MDLDNKNNKDVEVSSSSKVKSEKGGTSKCKMKKENDKQIENDEQSSSHRAPPGFENRKPPGFESNKPLKADKKVKPPPGFT